MKKTLNYLAQKLKTTFGVENISDCYKLLREIPSNSQNQVKVRILMDMLNRNYELTKKNYWNNLEHLDSIVVSSYLQNYLLIGGTSSESIRIGTTLLNEVLVDLGITEVFFELYSTGLKSKRVLSAFKELGWAPDDWCCELNSLILKRKD